jgi:hypothetical protein
MPRKKEASSNETAAAALAQADKAIAEARANLAEIRHQQRASTIVAALAGSIRLIS